ncbi:hypothetical protein A203_18605 [Chromobacterium violaceum]|uniref:SANT/Myb-like DNA-binding domain-containing protein n=1 Tax=Chromobacterium violaceum TaxID=536 RepID=UPI00385B5532
MKLPQADPDILDKMDQREFLDGLRLYWQEKFGEPLTNYKLAEIALVALNTVEGWRVDPGKKYHRLMSSRDRLFVVLRIMHQSGNKNRWTKEEDASLLEAAKKYGARHIYHAGLLPGRTMQAIQNRLKAIGPKKLNKWSESDDKWLKENYGNCTHQDLFSRFPDRSISAIKTRAAHLGAVRYSFAKSVWSADMDSFLLDNFKKNRDICYLRFKHLRKNQVDNRAKQLGIIGRVKCHLCGKLVNDIDHHMAAYHPDGA